MTVRDDNFRELFKMLDGIDGLADQMILASHRLRRTAEILRRGLEVEAQLQRGQKDHPPDPMELELEDCDD
jgi:hypothetical protein